MIYWLGLCLLPVLAALLALLWFKEHPEVPLVTGVGFALLAGIITAGLFAWGPEAESLDTEIWNGRIQSRWSQDVSCRHSYSCNCYESCTTDSRGNQSCTQICQTCYEHTFDRDWLAETTNSEQFDFPTSDRQGLEMPQRWAQVYVGEPTAVEHRFKNYFKLAIHNVVANFEDGIPNAGVPAYPSEYDYYRVNKVIDNEGVLGDQWKTWQWLLSELNADLGAKKQVNVILLFTKWSDPRYFFNVQKAWLGGKKNDVVVLISAQPSSGQINWVRVMSWSTDTSIRTSIRDDVQSAGSLGQRDAIVQAIRADVTAHFQRVHMKDQKYLREAWRPSSGTTWALRGLLAALSMVALFVGYYNVELENY